MGSRRLLLQLLPQLLLQLLLHLLLQLLLQLLLRLLLQFLLQLLQLLQLLAQLVGLRLFARHALCIVARQFALMGRFIDVRGIDGSRRQPETGEKLAPAGTGRC